jgi:hypothetical protein
MPVGQIMTGKRHIPTGQTADPLTKIAKAGGKDAITY